MQTITALRIWSQPQFPYLSPGNCKYFCPPLQIFPANCNYCNLCTPIELITNFKSDRLLILIVRTAVQAIASISIQVHIFRAICFPPTSHCTYFNATAILSIVMHAYVSRKLQLFQYNCQFRSNCASFNPFNHFEPTVIILINLTAATFQSSALFLNLAVVISSYLHAFQVKLLRRANCNYFRL